MFTMLSLLQFRATAAALCASVLLAVAATAAALGPADGSVPVAAAPDSRPPRHDLGRGMFLVASRQLVDPNFSESVVLLLEYDAKGALGLIVNRPTKVHLSELLPDIQELKERADLVYLGGPVAKNHVVLLMHSLQHPPLAGRVFADTYVSSSIEGLKSAVSMSGEGSKFHAYVGYSGWGPGQLDGEVSRGDWHVSPADEATVFDTAAEKIWPELIEKNSGQWVRDARERLQLARGYGLSGHLP